MDIREVKAQLSAILQNLPTHYSQIGARKLMLSFENYKQLARSLVNNSSAVRSVIRSEFDDIEADIKQAIKGTPKKEAESCFGTAKRHIAVNISGILTVIHRFFKPVLRHPILPA